MANSIIGMNGSIGAPAVTPKTSLNQPHWKMATTSP